MPAWAWGIGAAVVALAVAALFVARRRLVLVTVSGASMSPTLRDGDRVLVRRRRLPAVHRGDIVVLEPPHDPRVDYATRSRRLGGRPWNIKRVAALPGDPIPAGVGAGDEGTARCRPTRSWCSGTTSAAPTPGNGASTRPTASSAW